MAPPSDAEPVICALRLGWAVSELRGRLRPGEKLITVEPQTGRLRADHALPLGGERTVAEQLIEAETVVCSLAQQLSLDVELDGTPASQRLAALADAAWNELADFLYRWDAKIQDKLAGAAFSLASAYQLGRGLGEIAWLDPTQSEADVATSWTFVLGDLRVRTLKRLAVRLDDYFQPHTGPGLGSSLDVWKSAAADGHLRDKAETRTALVAQTRRWRDLLLTDLDPTTLLPPERWLARRAPGAHDRAVLLAGAARRRRVRRARCARRGVAGQLRPPPGRGDADERPRCGRAHVLDPAGKGEERGARPGRPPAREARLRPRAGRGHGLALSNEQAFNEQAFVAHLATGRWHRC